MAALRQALGRLRVRLAARPDTEHEQVLMRMAIGALLMLYLLPGADPAAQALVLFVGGAHLALSGLIFYRILRFPGKSPARRVIGISGDFTTMTCYLALLGERAAPLFLLYVWMTLANGFRFGRDYLLVSLGLGVAGFSVALWASGFWREHLAMGCGLLVAFIALSLYVQLLVAKLHDALSRAEAANLAKRRFISVVSHELRTPLNAIIGMADLLRDSSLSREQADMLQTLRGSSRIMLGLVEEVLDFSKIEAGKLTLETADFDLHALVNSTCRILAAQAAARKIEFVVSIMPEVPPAVRGDPHYLRQVLINLAGNALKFTERGSVTVHVAAQSEGAARVQLKFSIRDTGIGIAPEAQQRIFESFAQADESTTRRFGGTGLGTSIAKQLVGLMGGRIGLESAVGLGSTFWFELELEKQAERAADGELAGARVLLVGFPAAARAEIESALGSWGAAPVAAASLEEGVRRLVAEIAVARPYHCAMLYAAGRDAAMAREYRRAAPDPAPPAILAVPREARVPRFEALASGFAAMLELPFDKRGLFNVLHSVSAGRDAREGVVRLQDYARGGAGDRRLRVLVADDNPTNREVLGKILERGGHAVTVVEGGEQALDAIERARFDAVILDRNMPGTSGIEALQAIRLLHAGRERVPVMILSADATREARREALEAGADAFVPKPVEALQLLEEVRSLAAGQGAAPREEPAAGRVAAQAAPAAPPAVVNRDALGRLEELSSAPGFVAKVADIFCADAAALLGRMEKAVSGREFGEFRSQLHAMKGSSASMGADRLSRLCGVLGRHSDAELQLQGPGLLRALTEEFEQARGELERYVREQRRSAS